VNTTITHTTNAITDLLPVVIAILFFAAGWLAGRMRMWSTMPDITITPDKRRNTRE